MNIHGTGGVAGAPARGSRRAAGHGLLAKRRPHQRERLLGHAYRNFIDLKTRLCPVTDQAFSALLEDLQQRGMLDETLIVWTGEMGRTPRVGQKRGRRRRGRPGRSRSLGQRIHHGAGGGGIKGGVVHGSSDRYAAYPATQPTPPADLAATIYHCLGVDPHLQLTDTPGAPRVHARSVR